MEIKDLLLNPAALEHEMRARVGQGEFHLRDPADEAPLLEAIRKYYTSWLHRLDTVRGLENMTRVSTSFKLNRRKLQRSEWVDAVLPFDTKNKTDAEKWPLLKQVSEPQQFP